MLCRGTDALPGTVDFRPEVGGMNPPKMRQRSIFRRYKGSDDAQKPASDFQVKIPKGVDRFRTGRIKFRDVGSLNLDRHRRDSREL